MTYCPRHFLNFLAALYVQYADIHYVQWEAFNNNCCRLSANIELYLCVYNIKHRHTYVCIMHNTNDVSDVGIVFYCPPGYEVL